MPSLKDTFLMEEEQKNQLHALGELQGTRHHVVSDHSQLRDVDDLLASSITKKLYDRSPLPNTCCIFKVPKPLRAHNDKACTPNVVSIGPFHSNNDSLQTMEKVKLWYLHSLLSRISIFGVTLKSLIERTRELEKRARECYAEHINLSEDEFVEMMIVDGCFIIEHLRKKEKKEWDEHDPIRNMICMHAYISRDLLLLENQLPWFVLQCLFTLITPQQENTSLTGLVNSYFCHPFFRFTRFPSPNFAYEYLHILDFTRNQLLPPHRNLNPYTHPRKFVEATMIPSATKLKEAGVKFKKGTSVHLLDVKFSNGVFEIPQLSIDERTEPLFRNLIAFEQCYHSCTREILSYAILLHCLIDTSKDVDILCDKRIIRNCLSAEDASQFFNRLHNDTSIVIADYNNAAVRVEVNAYCQTVRHKWRATLMREYFNTPWKTLSCFAAIVLLVLTLVQAVYSIKNCK